MNAPTSGQIYPVTLSAILEEVTRGLKPLEAVVPLSAVEWADQFFYLSPESSYIEGPWTTAPFQVALLNSMGSDSVREVYVQKSARCGYTKCLIAALLYLTEHKKRNTLIYQPSDGDASDFVKDEIDPALRDCSVMHPIFPGLGKKGEGNTESKKQFIGATMDIKGGTTPKNYRRMSKDVAAQDELDGFPWVIGADGDAKMLARKRLVGATFPKYIAGTTPLTAGRSHIEQLMASADVVLRFHVPCPHCSAEQDLKWGGADCDYGIKWVGGDSSAAAYLCEHCGALIDYGQLGQMQLGGRWICDRTGIWTRDGLHWFAGVNATVVAPRRIGFYIWAAYSLTSSWSDLVDRYLEAKKSPDTLKTFVNTDLGELWEEDQGEQLDYQVLLNRRERWAGQVPDRVCYLTGGIDTQGDRLEFYVWGWDENEEAYLIWRYILWGDTSKPIIWRQAQDIINDTVFTYSDGLVVNVGRWGWDTGGHRTSEVYKSSKALGIRRVLPIKGHSHYGKPVAEFPRKRNKDGVHLTMVGTDTAKDVLMARLKDGAMIHLPLDDEICGEDECKQLTSERRVWKIKDRKRINVWDNENRRNEALDCFVYAYAALRVSVDHFNIKLTPRGQVSSASADIAALARKLSGKG
ncbi:terminase gpA endonuclease subunit [Oceanospirillum sp. HFRX-1_2]